MYGSDWLAVIILIDTASSGLVIGSSAYVYPRFVQGENLYVETLLYAVHE